MASSQDDTSFNRKSATTQRNKPYSRPSTTTTVDHITKAYTSTPEMVPSDPLQCNKPSFRDFKTEKDVYLGQDVCGSTLKMKSSDPHNKPDPSKSMPEVDNKDLTVFFPEVINRFRLGKFPYTQIIVGLKGMHPEILLTRQGKVFAITKEELAAIDPAKEKSVLSSEPTDGGYLMCNFQVDIHGNSSFERLLEPYSCPMDSSDNLQTSFQLSRYETENFKIHLQNIKSAVESFEQEQAVFRIMYKVIVSTMLEIYESMNTSEGFSEVFDEVLRLTKQCTSPAFWIQEYFKKGLPTPFELYKVVDACLGQRRYLKQRLGMEVFLSDLN